MATVYDVVVVGSGAAGGTLAAHLARSGAHVAMVEGGPKINTRTDFPTHSMPWEFANRQIPRMKPGKPGMESERARGLGGKTLTWNAVAWRFSQRDFKGKTFDGGGEDWPIDYAELAPYYDRVEREVGVCGNYDGLKDLPDGIFLPPAPYKCSDKLIDKGARKLGLKTIHVRKATLTQAKFGRPGCHFCGNCMAGCDVVAKYNSYDVHLVPAMKTGNLEMIPNAVVREVMMGADGRARGVKFLHRETKAEGEVLGKAVVVSCACVQSVALLQMSAKGGLANSSGQLGKHFIPHFTGGVEAFLDGLMGTPLKEDEGFLDHAYLPSFMHERKRDYVRSFGAQFGYQNRRGVGWARETPGMGAAYKKAVKERYPAFVVFSPYGEMVPNRKSYVDLDYAKLDQYGLPSARRQVTWMDNDWKIFRDMQNWSKEILLAAGAKIQRVWEEPRTNHELGGARMGNDPRTSVVNAYCQTHDVKNLFVLDGSVFPSASEKNPTLTIMALAARTAEHMAERAKRRTVMAERRDALKIIGSISATCAFPFAADELYAQHEGTHGTVSGQAALPEPAYFSKADFATIAAIAERIIPQTDTPGAGAAGVPAYIDFVVGRNPAQQKVFTAGLAWLKKQTAGKPFAELDEKAQLAILEPLCARCDAGPAKGTGERFFKTVKALTADGYWTSKAGMADTLGFKGNAILGAYPECLHEH